MFSIRGLRLYFPELGPWVTPSVLLPCWTAHSTSRRLAGQLPPCPHGSTVCHLTGSAKHCLAHPAPPATTLPQVLSAQLPVSTPPTGLDECFFFNSLVVGLSYSSIFCQFWLFLVFKLLLSFFWLCEEAQCVYLGLHLGWKSNSNSSENW